MKAATCIVKKDISLGVDGVIKRGEEITITLKNSETYVLWCNHGIFLLPEEYIDKETIKFFTNE